MLNELSRNPTLQDGVVHRVLLGSLVLIFVHSLQDIMWAKKSFFSCEIQTSLELLLLCVLGVILALNWVFFFSAVIYTDIAKATLIYYLAPILVVVLSSVFLREDYKKKIIFSIFGIFRSTYNRHSS